MFVLLSNSPSLAGLFTQVQARYPGASLISELLNIHKEQYVVRAIVRMGESLLSTGLAAAVDIEQAEDRAKVRALETLVAPAVPSTFTPSFQPSQPVDYNLLLSPPAPPVDAGNSTAAPIAPPIAPPEYEPAPAPIDPVQPVAPALAPEPVPPAPAEFTLGYTPQEDMPLAEPVAATSPSIEPPPGLSYTFEPEPPEPDVELPISLPLDLPAAAPEADRPSRTPAAASSPKRKASAKTSAADEKASQPSPTAATTSWGGIDRSDEIAQITIEMKRLGWTTEQGRAHLKQTYGKRSRQELNDDELLDFLRYLQTQPSPAQSPF